jgi:transglutaminase-like putative cysteine protease
MKTFFSAALISLTIAGALQAQTKYDFGKFNIDEVTMKTYAPDPIAEAVVLYDLGNTYFTYEYEAGFEIIFERTTKIKILSKAGIKYAEVEVPYFVNNNGHEEVYEIEGCTYNLENNTSSISKLDAANVYVEKTNENWFTKKFALPDVKEGSVIEYRYKVSSPFYFNFQNWVFQGRIPKIYSEYTARMIPFFEYSYILQGAAKFDVFNNRVDDTKKSVGVTEYNDNIYTFGMRNIPAFRDEDYITSMNDYIQKLDFQLAVVHHLNGGNENIITTWPMLIQDLLKDSEFGLYMRSIAKNADEIMASIDLTSGSNRDKAERIYKYVKGNYNWSGMQSKQAGKTAKEFLKTKTGNAADINLFLCSLLNSAGIQAFPVLLSTRDHGKIPTQYPFSKFMNYVIVLVRTDNQDIMLDATEPLSPFGMLPSRCINDKGLIAAKDKTEWIQMEDQAGSEVADSGHVSFNETLDSVTIDFNLRATGHKGLEYRSSYQDDPEEFKKEFYTADMAVKKEIAVLNEFTADLPFIHSYTVSVPIETVGNKLLVMPFPGLTPQENPLKLPFRSYPVDMVYKNKHSFYTHIDIPKGYKYMDQNKSVSVDNNLVNIQYVIECKPDGLSVKGSYEFKKPVYLKHEYYDLKSYMTKIVETFNDKIVFVKDQV